MDTKTIKTAASVFELPQKLGILQYVDYVPEKQCTTKGCLYEGLLTAEGCKRGVCVRYRVLVHSKDRRRWEAKGRWEKGSEEIGGCLRQSVADALWELAGMYEVEVWYEYKTRCSTCPGMWTMADCGIALNGIRLHPPYCHTVSECIEQILKDYRRAVEVLKEPPMKAQDYDATKFLKEHPELQVFGVDWVKTWLPYAKERMMQIAKILQNEKVKAIEKIGIRENPHLIEIYTASDEVCIAVSAEVYCLSDQELLSGRSRARKMSLDYIGLTKPKGLMAFVKTKGFVRVV